METWKGNLSKYLRNIHDVKKTLDIALFIVENSIPRFLDSSIGISSFHHAVILYSGVIGF